MAIRSLLPSPRCSKAFSRRACIASHRDSSSERGHESLRFTCALQENARADHGIFAALGGKPFLTNPGGHDAAVLLATPGLATQILDSDFMGAFASLIKADGKVDRFHVLAAVVDGIPSPLGTYRSLQGLSVLRGRLEDILPHLWSPSAPMAKEDGDAVAALNFGLGRSSLTLPLARTTFHNHRTSTLVAQEFDTSSSASRSVQSLEKHAQDINLASVTLNAHSVPGPSVWAQLIPLTPCRTVTDSFGNIVKGLSVDDQTVPASTELEHAVNTAFDILTRSGTQPGPLGVWALVTPASTGNGTGRAEPPSPMSFIHGDQHIGDVVEISAEYIHEMHREGSRLYRVLSGGGGWGAKKGLLSLDPQTRHFALSEEEELQRFMHSMENSIFASPGSKIQFFMPPGQAMDIPKDISSDIIFGIPGPSESASSSIDSPLELHFGALSDSGIFLLEQASSTKARGSAANESKLDLPNGRVSFCDTSWRGGGIWSKLADSLTLAGRDIL